MDPSWCLIWSFAFLIILGALSVPFSDLAVLYPVRSGLIPACQKPPGSSEFVVRTIGSPDFCAEAAFERDHLPPREYRMARVCQSGRVVRNVRSGRIFCVRSNMVPSWSVVIEDDCPRSPVDRSMSAYLGRRGGPSRRRISGDGGGAVSD